MKHDLTHAIARIRQMEYYFNAAIAALQQGIPAEYPMLQALLRTLERYQSSGAWLHDYERDERGELPPGLKRSVLSQDALYDLLQSAK